MTDASMTVATNSVSPGAVAGALRDAPIAPLPGSDNSEQLDWALQHATTVLAKPSDGRWKIRLPGIRRAAQVQLSPEWLSMSLPLRALNKPPDPELIGRMLDRNTQTQGARVIGHGLERQRELVIDVPVDLLPWDDQSELEILAASMIAILGNASSATTRRSAIPPREPLPAEQLEAAFDEAGWPLQSGAAEKFEVPLEVPGTYLAAQVSHDSRGTRLRVPLLVNELASASLDCRSAVIVLLWLTVSRIRMVKATRSRQALALEVALQPGHANAAALGHSCAVLSAALQQFVREAQVLANDQHLARIYLPNLGFPTGA